MYTNNHIITSLFLRNDFVDNLRDFGLTEILCLAAVLAKVGVSTLISVKSMSTCSSRNKNVLSLK